MEPQVLVVDDDPVSCEILSGTLAEAGHPVLHASDGREGLHVLRREPCQLVICDWEMPVLDGLEFCRTVRAGAWDRYVYVILLTCREGASNIVTGLSAGADDFITKPFDPDELMLRLGIARRVLALETRELVIFALAKLAESRDTDTGAHLERTRSYCRLLAGDLAGRPEFAHLVDAEFIRLIYLTAPLHDIGKVAIPDCILLKPGRLDEEEFALMKGHAASGAETLLSALQRHPNARFLSMAVAIARHHHERWDGGGYPSGLAGDAIPLAARIFALADVYDALVSKRVYKKAYTHQVAKGIILDGEGTHFDPRIVEAFCRQEEAFVEAKANLAAAPCPAI